MGKCGLFDLEKHFAFYGAYHSNPTNIAIHMMFVWPIFFAALLILYFTPSLLNLRFSLFGNDVDLLLNFGSLSALIYTLFYICLDAKAGSFAALHCSFCWVSSWLEFSLAWKAGQFIGHGVFEKGAPAFLDNLSLALIMAPLFVLLETLQAFLDYEPCPGFHENVQAKIKAEIND
ncbi:hypothetical protein P3X46_017304 [Hevea brasiliensis]|uniref:DUF962 domain-containing protein n=1 Tax=Hevea brasiliensis TaxID=3981 RepID=A0ABQ9M488_HEVBR|nr:hypothetical protein P3X46_017304 [Hevea brasiliensis]